jgi:hypothetical protein
MVRWIVDGATAGKKSDMYSARGQWREVGGRGAGVFEAGCGVSAINAKETMGYELGSLKTLGGEGERPRGVTGSRAGRVGGSVAPNGGQRGWVGEEVGIMQLEWSRC